MKYCQQTTNNLPLSLEYGTCLNDIICIIENNIKKTNLH